MVARIFTGSMVAGLFLAAGIGCSTAAASTMPPAVMHSALRASTPIPGRSSLTTKAAEHPQLADEITRRLRRLGVRTVHNPEARPPEMIGQIC